MSSSSGERDKILQLLELFLLTDNNAALDQCTGRTATHELFETRDTQGEYATLFPLLKRHPDKFHKYMRMKLETFNYILNKIELDPTITKKWCNFHKQPIYPEQQLVVFLR